MLGASHYTNHVGISPLAPLHPKGYHKQEYKNLLRKLKLADLLDTLFKACLSSLLHYPSPSLPFLSNFSYNIGPYLSCITTIHLRIVNCTGI